MKRFSWLAFVGAMLVHIYITGELIGADMRASGLVAPGPRSIWLNVWMWIFQPIPMLLWVAGSSLDNSYRFAIAVAWSICIGASFGFLVPRLFRWRRRIV